MKFLLIYLLIAFTSSKDYNYFYDIIFEERYEIDVTKFPSGYIPKASLYFTVLAEKKDEISFQVRLLKSDKMDFKVKVSGFTQYPTDSEIVNGTDNIELEGRILSTLYDYVTYDFNAPTLKKQDKIKYYVFTVLNNANLSYLSLYAYEYVINYLEYTFYKMNYMKEEILNKTAIRRHIGAFLFTVENKDLGKNKLIRIKLSKDHSKKIEISFVAGFKERPTTQKELKSAIIGEDLEIKSSTKDENYKIYEFSVENPEVNKQKYIAFAMYLEETLDFVNFYIGPQS